MKRKRLIPTGIAARILEVSPEWVRRMADQGILKVVRIGKMRFFNEPEIRELLHKRQKTEV